VIEIREYIDKEYSMNKDNPIRSQEEWQDHYTKMSIFYQDRLNHVENMLEKSMEMNLRLVSMLGKIEKKD
jgi:hypothetical protein